MFIICIPGLLPLPQWSYFSAFPCLLQSLFSIRRLAKANGPRKTILITGVSMTKGLVLARILHKHAHHRIAAAEDEPIFCALSPGRFSCAVSKFHRLKSPLSGSSDLEERNTALYITSLRVIKVETVDWWIGCLGVASSVEDGKVAEMVERKTGAKCRAVQFGAEMTKRLHEKGKFTSI